MVAENAGVRKLPIACTTALRCVVATGATDISTNVKDNLLEAFFPP